MRESGETRHAPESSRTRPGRARARVVDSARAPVASRRADRTGGPTRCTAETPPGGAERARRAREPLSRAHVHIEQPLAPFRRFGALRFVGMPNILSFRDHLTARTGFQRGVPSEVRSLFSGAIPLCVVELAGIPRHRTACYMYGYCPMRLSQPLPGRASQRPYH